jgi:hypothetical protein
MKWSDLSFLFPPFENDLNPVDAMENLEALMWARQEGIDLVTRQTTANYDRINRDHEVDSDVKNIDLNVIYILDGLWKGTLQLTFEVDTGTLGVEPK